MLTTQSYGPSLWAEEVTAVDPADAAALTLALRDRWARVGDESPAQQGRSAAVARRLDHRLSVASVAGAYAAAAAAAGGR